MNDILLYLISPNFLMKAPRFEGFKRTENLFELVCFKRRNSQPSTTIETTNMAIAQDP